eukprot:gene11136-12135_t
MDKGTWNGNTNVGPASWCIQQRGTNTNKFQFLFNYASGSYLNGGDFSLTANVWTHIVMSKQGKSLKYYVNGVFQATYNVSSSVIASSGALPLVIGANNYGYSNPVTTIDSPFTGRLDDIFLYDRSLSTWEVQKLSNPTRMPTTTTAPPNVLSTDPVKQFSIISESLRFKQSNFLFGSMTGSVISGQIVVRSGDLGANFVIYGSKKQIGFIEINSTSVIRGRVGGITPDTPGARSVSVGGDFNRDRRVDYLVGDPVQSKVYVISVVSGLTKLISRLSGKQGSGFGWAVSSIADFNSDGVDDFIVSALYESRCFIIFGSKDLTDMSIDAATLPPAIGVSVRVDADDSLVSAFAVAVASVRDLNGDGWPDIAMSAQMRDGTSTIYILFGSANLFSSSSQTALSVTIQLNDIIQQKLATRKRSFQLWVQSTAQLPSLWSF